MTRDVDLLAELAKCFSSAAVFVSVTTLDPELTAVMEPRTSVPRKRLEAIETLSRRGRAGRRDGRAGDSRADRSRDARDPRRRGEGRCETAGYVPVRLPFAVKDLFQTWLSQHFPDRKDKILNRIRSLRGGKLNDGDFVSRMRGEGVWAEQLKSMFELAKRKAGLDGDFPHLSTDHFAPPRGPQMTLWQD